MLFDKIRRLRCKYGNHRWCSPVSPLHRVCCYCPAEQTASNVVYCEDSEGKRTICAVLEWKDKEPKHERID